MSVTPPSHPALRGLVTGLWVSRSAWGGPERALPTGVTHLVARIEGPPPRIDGTSQGRALVAGPRAAPYLRESDVGAVSVGVMLAPGAAPLLLGVPARELAGRHLGLDTLPDGRALVDALCAAVDGELAPLEQVLVSRLGDRRLDPRISSAARALVSRPEEEVAAGLGLSARRLRGLFTDAVGLTPRDHRRVARLQRVLRDVERHPERAWSERAVLLGFCDQAHLCREFSALTGVSPTRYAPRPGQPNHLPLPMDPSRAAPTG